MSEHLIFCLWGCKSRRRGKTYASLLIFLECGKNHTYLFIWKFEGCQKRLRNYIGNQRCSSPFACFVVICSDNGLEKHITGDSITIVAGSSHRVLVIVDRKQSVITWEFTARGYDILFGIMKNDDLSDEPPEFVSPLLTYSSDRVHSGSLTVNEPGRYILCWDNSRSWLREKTISYKVNVRKLERSVEEISSFSKY